MTPTGLTSRSLATPPSPRCGTRLPDGSANRVREGVRLALDGATPEQLHESWCANMHAAGWGYGETKDETARTHPCLVPHAELPDEQR
ncbi:RyR domain-containing protein [Actinomadura geliboluensis]|uniref:RyR domain-containing protein n=1 Tax=Actinomadura geliboluensis TaxID=882440 RepID=UPI003715C885